MKRLLCIVANMNAGGAETFLMKIYRNIDRREYQFDFCVNADKNFYQNEIESMGGKIYKIPTKSSSLIKYIRELRKVVKDNEHKYVIRVNEHSLSVIDLLIARTAGAECLIMRSSNADTPGKISKMMHIVFKFLPKFVPDIKIAPSRKAAEYTFGKKSVKKGEVIILHNGIDINNFKFSNEIRSEYRKALGLEDKIIIGHVGRFSEQKNHKFLLKIFSQIVIKEPHAELLLIGEGILKEEIKKEAIDLGISDKVMFLGLRSDVNYLMMAMDIFLFPSLFEGMPNTVIEAQATGLPCLISDTITEEANITGLVSYYSLKNSEKQWAEKCLQIALNNHSRNTEKDFYNNGYDIKSVSDIFVDSIFS